MSRRSRNERLVLLASASERPLDAGLQAALPALTAAGSRNLLLAASQHGVTGFVCRTLLGTAHLSTALRTALEGAHDRVLRDHLRALAELARIAQALDELGGPWLVFKGPALAHAAYPLPYLREYLDLDLLVPASAVEATLRQLTDMGCRVVDRPWEDLRRERAGEVKLVSSGGVVIDLHWELLNDWEVRRAFRLPSTEELLARAVPIRLGAAEVRTLDPVDTLLHVALHACTSGGWRLLWLKDVAQSLPRTPPHAAALSARARSWQVQLPVALMIERARRVLGATATPTLPPDLGGASPWLRLVAAVDAVAPVEGATGAGSLTRIVTNSTRRSTLESTAELARRSVAYAVQGSTAAAVRRGQSAADSEG